MCYLDTVAMGVDATTTSMVGVTVEAVVIVIIRIDGKD